MAKTQEELEALKNECVKLVNKLKELDENELKEVTGGIFMKNDASPGCGGAIYYASQNKDIDIRKDLYENIILNNSKQNSN